MLWGGTGRISKRRAGSLSYPGPLCPQPEHTGRLLARGCSSTSRVGEGAPSTQRTAPYTNDLIFWTRLRIVLSCIPFPSLWVSMVCAHCHLPRDRSGMLP